MATPEKPSESEATHLSQLGHALSRLAGVSDLDGLLQTLCEELLRVGGAAAVEVSFFAGGRPQAAAELTLQADGSRADVFPAPSANPAVGAMLENGAPLLVTLSGVGLEPVDGLTHALAIPMRTSPVRPSGDTEPLQGPPLGAVLVGYAGAPELPPARPQLIEILVRSATDRMHNLLTTQARRRYQSHMGLLGEISGMVVGPGMGERLFSQAIQRIELAFDLELAAVYAGRPLTLRLQFGGRAGRPGEPVPEGLAHQAVQRQEPMVIDDLAEPQTLPIPHWAPQNARSEIAIPLRYQNRRIGVLDFYSAHPEAFDQLDIDILVALSHLLAILIVQERWDNQDYTSEQMREAYDRLQEFAELKDQILQNVSHELRTPLTLVKGYLELMLDDQMGTLDKEQKDTIETVVDKVDQIVRIVEQIVALSPHSRLSVQYQKISVRTLFEEMALVFTSRTDTPAIDWDFQVEGDDLYLNGDIDKIRQVCYNILENSIKFSPGGGRISVRATSEQSYVHLIFEDEGIGIPQPRLSQIFETFYQVDGSSTRRFGGLGLGLAVVNRAVAAHDGKAWAESVLGEGSTFHVLLPKYESPRRVLRTGLV